MSTAYRFATLLRAYCQVTWPTGKSGDMESTMAEHFVDDFNGKYSSHKYFDADAATEHLGLPKGAGIYGCYVFPDGSWVGLTCNGPLALCDAKGLRFLPTAAAAA